MRITPLEANLLLFALDLMCKTNSKGLVTQAFVGYTLDEIQSVRDRLFAKHEHPPEDDDGEEG